MTTSHYEFLQAYAGMLRSNRDETQQQLDFFSRPSCKMTCNGVDVTEPTKMRIQSEISVFDDLIGRVEHEIAAFRPLGV